MPAQVAHIMTSSSGGGGGKDPLHTDQTAYEILGIDRKATSTDIQNAFRVKLGKVNVTKLSAAKRLLDNPLDRALLDLFHYLPEFAEQLSPNPLVSIAVLDLNWRAQTATAWEQQLCSAFPDVAAAHSLALLWYWWGIWDEEHQNGPQVKHGDGFNGLDRKWRKAIACWSMVLSSDDFWVRSGVNRESIPQVRSAISDKLRTRLQELAQKHKQNASEGLAECYRDLEVGLMTELRTSGLMAKVGLRTKRGKLACGPLMIDLAGLADMVGDTIEAAISKNPRNEDLLRLRDSMPPYGTVYTLLENNKPQAAIDELSELPSKFRDSSQGKRLLIRAYYSLGKQQAGLTNVDAAMNAWETALASRPESDIKEKIYAEIVSTCKTRVASLRQTQSDAAIVLLERALRLTNDVDLKLLLAELLTSRAIEKINDAQKLAGPDGTNNLERVAVAIRTGTADLERAEALGSKRASEQLAVAKSILENVTIGPSLRDAHAAADRGDWETAIRYLRTALAHVSEPNADTIRKNLAVCLANRAMQIANDALANPSPSALDSLRSAERDLTEAVQLDPSNAHARKNLDDLQKFLRDIGRGGRLPSVDLPGTSRPYVPPRRQPRSGGGFWKGIIGAATQTWWMWLLYFFFLAPTDSSSGENTLWKVLAFIGLFIWTGRCFAVARRQ